MCGMILCFVLGVVTGIVVTCAYALKVNENNKED